MKTRTYEFYKIGYKVPGDTEYTFLNEPWRSHYAATLAAQDLIKPGKALTQSCIARFQILEVYNRDET